MDTSIIAKRIKAAKDTLGQHLTIMAHHYQSDNVIRHADLRGDSLELARRVTEVTSENILFCGVRFMAESAALLASPKQKVYLPDLTAECSMAEMADGPVVERVLAKLNASGRRVIPLAYVNSTASVKTVVGSYGGSVCTSANAEKMLRHTLLQGDAVLFLPDQNLGLNTAKIIGLAPLEQIVLDVQGQGESFDPLSSENCRLLLWPGYCSIHTFFTPEHVATARKLHPEAQIIVHPECTPEVVNLVDAAGSTSWMINYANEAKTGSTLIIGTEVNLVQRLAKQYADKLNILPLSESACEYMAKITEERLADALESILAGKETYRVTVPEESKVNALLSMERMLQVK